TPARAPGRSSRVCRTERARRPRAARPRLALRDQGETRTPSSGSARARGDRACTSYSPRYRETSWATLWRNALGVAPYSERERHVRHDLQPQALVDLEAPTRSVDGRVEIHVPLDLLLRQR